MVQWVERDGLAASWCSHSVCGVFTHCLAHLCERATCAVLPPSSGMCTQYQHGNFGSHKAFMGACSISSQSDLSPQRNRGHCVEHKGSMLASSDIHRQVTVMHSSSPLAFLAALLAACQCCGLHCSLPYMPPLCRHTGVVLCSLSDYVGFGNTFKSYCCYSYCQCNITASYAVAMYTLSGGPRVKCGAVGPQVVGGCECCCRQCAPSSDHGCHVCTGQVWV